jgi:hypothetical protein
VLGGSEVGADPVESYRQVLSDFLNIQRALPELELALRCSTAWKRSEVWTTSGASARSQP